MKIIINRNEFYSMYNTVGCLNDVYDLNISKTAFNEIANKFAKDETGTIIEEKTTVIYLSKEGSITGNELVLVIYFKENFIKDTLGLSQKTFLKFKPLTSLAKSIYEIGSSIFESIEEDAKKLMRRWL